MIEELRRKALELGATEFGESRAKNKRFYVMYGGMRINFGLKGGHTYIDHHDDQKRRAWRARHSVIKNDQGQYVINLKSSPSYWSYHILWS